MWRDVIESVHLKRAETNFRLLVLACETLQFSLVMTNIHTKRTHSSTTSYPGCRQAMFFQLLSTKLGLVDKFCKVLIYVLFYKSGTKNQFSRFLPRWWPCLVTLRASSRATTYKIIPYPVEKIKGFPLNAKSFWNTATYQKLWGWVYHPPCTTVRVWLCVYMYVRGFNLQ